MILSNRSWQSKKLDVLHPISGNHDAQQHLCSSCLRALMKFSMLLFPCLASPCDRELPGVPLMKFAFPGQSIKRAVMMSLTNSDLLPLWMIYIYIYIYIYINIYIYMCVRVCICVCVSVWVILGNPTYESTYTLISFPTSLGTKRNITWSLEK